MKKIVLVIFFIASSPVNSATIDSLEITGGSFELSNLTGILNPADFANMTIGGYDGSEPLTIGTESSYASTSVATFEWALFGPAAVYTSESDSIFGTNVAPVTGGISNNNLTLDLSSWIFFWNGISINVGSSSSLITNPQCNSKCTTPIVTTYNSVDGTFTASWDAVMV